MMFEVCVPKCMMTKLKICLTFFQLSSTANFNLGVKMPAFFTGLMNKLAPIVAIQPISFMPIACTSEFARTYAFTLEAYNCFTWSL